MHIFTHRVQFYETDLMGIVHHSNYLRFCEEARVAWAHSTGLIDYQSPESAAQFAVLETHVKHRKPCHFGDIVKIDLQVRRLGIRLEFYYRLHTDRHAVVAEVTTVHVPLDRELKVTRLPAEMIAVLEKEKWIET